MVSVSVQGNTKTVLVTTENQMRNSSAIYLKGRMNLLQLRKVIAIFMVMQIFTISLGFTGTAQEASVDSEDIILGKFDTDSAINNWGLTKSTDVIRMYDRSAKWVCANVDSTTKLYSTHSNPSGFPADLTGYTMFNAWIYLPEAFGSNVSICMMSDQSNGNNYYLYQLVLDWTGWKKISIPFSEFIKVKSPNWSDIRYFTISASGWPKPGLPSYDIATMYFDQVWLSKSEIAPQSILSATPKSGYDDFPIYGGEVSVQFCNQLLTPIRKDAVSVYNETGDTIDQLDMTVTDGNKLTVKVNQMLDFSAKYRVALNDTLFDSYGQSVPAEFTFTTMNEGLSAAIPSLKDSNGTVLAALPASGKIIASTNVVNHTEEDLPATLIVAVYDQNGALIDIAVQEHTVLKNDDETISIEMERSSYANCSVKAFACDSLKTMNLLRAEFLQIS